MARNSKKNTQKNQSSNKNRVGRQIKINRATPENVEIILLNKPFQVISQFSESGDKTTLAKFIKRQGFYPAGRLDYDSEGLLLLTNNGAFQARISHPKYHSAKTYWVQVEGQISDEALQQLRSGVELKDGKTLAAKAQRIEQPESLWPRVPPIRERKNIPTSWISLTIKEGKNRQVRRMTAKVSFPTLRLIRYSIGDWSVDGLKPGAHQSLTIKF